METKRIETLSKWLVLKQMIKDKGYTFWQSQYDWNEPEGYHAGFMKDDNRLKVITHNEAIEKDIIESS